MIINWISGFLIGIGITNLIWLCHKPIKKFKHQVEAPKVSDNEGKKKICPNCKGVGEKFIYACKGWRPCHKCEGTGLI